MDPVDGHHRGLRAPGVRMSPWLVVAVMWLGALALNRIHDSLATRATRPQRDLERPRVPEGYESGLRASIWADYSADRISVISFLLREDQLFRVRVEELKRDEDLLQRTDPWSTALAPNGERWEV